MMKNKFSIIYACVVCILVFSSCSGVFEDDLDDGTFEVKIKSPNDSIVTNSLDITFWWEEMIEAKQYHLQVVHPDFNAIEYFVLDTIITDFIFTYTFEQKGEYAWRVRAENNSSETPYISRSFTIDNTIDLVEHTLIVVKPAKDFATNAIALVFSWVDIAVADEYIFSVQKDDAEGEYIVEPTLLYDNSYLLDNSIGDFSAGKYYWSVQAKNDLPSKTAEVIRSFTVDRTPPGIPVSLFPINDTILTAKTITFRWERYDDGTGSAIYDSLYLMKKNATDIFEIFRKAKNSTSIPETTITALPSGEYQWYLKTFDKAKNASDVNGLESFVIE